MSHPDPPSPPSIYDSPPSPRACRLMTARILERQIRARLEVPAPKSESEHLPPPEDDIELDSASTASISENEEAHRSFANYAHWIHMGMESEEDPTPEGSINSDSISTDPRDIPENHSDGLEPHTIADKEPNTLGFEGNPGSPAMSVVATSEPMEDDYDDWNRTVIPIRPLNATTEWMEWGAGEILPIRTLFEMLCSLAEEIQRAERRTTEMRRKYCQLMDQVKLQMGIPVEVHNKDEQGSAKAKAIFRLPKSKYKAPPKSKTLGYACPFLGAYVADTFVGHFWTLFYAAGITASGYTILTVSSVQGIIETSTAKYLFIVSLVILGVGIGAFKACITPLIAAQYRRSKLSVSTTAKGERVIIDPSLSALRVYMYFYEANLLGAVAASVGLVYAEKFVGFWLCYTIPATILFLSATGLWLGRKNYSHNPHTPPPGPVLTTFLRALCYASKGKWSLNPFRVWKSFTADNFWETAKPSNVQGTPPKWMTYDDEWIDEVRRGVKACGVFLWYPIYWTTNGQLIDNLSSQAMRMTIHGLPLDVLFNLAAIATIILIPVFDVVFYPILRLSGIKFTPLKRITTGFLLGSLAMAWAAVIQHFVYKTSPLTCGSDSDDSFCFPSFSGLSIWLQSGSYILTGMSQILTLVTGLEYAFTKAPRSMRALVAAVYLLMQAISTGLSQALVSLSADPLLVWNFGSIAVVALLSGALFWVSVRNLDKHEDELNNLPEGHLRARDPSRRGNGDGDSTPIHKEQLEYDSPLEPVWFIMDLADL